MFYPEDDPVPVGLISQVLVLEPLSLRHLELDYEAVMETKDYLRKWSLSDWPADDFTIEGNAEDLAHHEEEHFDRIAFTYTVLNTDASKCLGCVYMAPMSPETIKTLVTADKSLAEARYLATVSFWVRQSMLTQEFDKTLFEKLSYWIPEEFSFSRVIYMTSDQDLRQIELFTKSGLTEIHRVPSQDGRGAQLYFA